jgi:hypothetical protein
MSKPTHTSKDRRRQVTSNLSEWKATSLRLARRRCLRWKLTNGHRTVCVGFCRLWGLSAVRVLLVQR